MIDTAVIASSFGALIASDTGRWMDLMGIYTEPEFGRVGLFHSDFIRFNPD